MKQLVIMMIMAALAALWAAPASADTIAIVGATVYQRSDQKLEGATVVIRDGKIAEVGVGIAVPPEQRGSTARARSSPRG